MVTAGDYSRKDIGKGCQKGVASSLSVFISGSVKMARVLSFDMGSRNLAFALIEAPATVVRMGMIDLQKHAAREATAALVETLAGDNNWMMAGGYPIVIELQPRSGVCKVLSHVLQAAFHTYDAVYFDTLRDIKFMHAMQKFKVDPICFREHAPATYDDRKRCAVDMARKVLQSQTDAKFFDFFESRPYKQQTDLADAIMQGCRYHMA